MRRIIVSVALSLFLLCPSMIFALPIGDAPDPPYPYAEHDDGFYQFIGADWYADDGISWTTFAPGHSADITFTVNTEGDYEWFRIWIDWDQSSGWEADELMIDLQDYWFDAGATMLTETIAVPNDALLGSTWMRARFGFDGPYSPDGWAAYGEVEDYEVDVVPEPGTILMLATGLLGMAGYVRMKSRRKK